MCSVLVLSLKKFQTTFFDVASNTVTEISLAALLRLTFYLGWSVTFLKQQSLQLLAHPVLRATVGRN